MSPRSSMRRLLRRIWLAGTAGLIVGLASPSAVHAQGFDYSQQPNYNRFTGVGGLTADSHFVSFGTTGFNGTFINNFVGATRFYTEGFTGTTGVVANIEAGHMAGGVAGLSGVDGGLYSGGHSALSHVSTFMASTSNPQSVTQLVDRHATWASQAMGGRGPGNVERGIAHNATMWSGAIATSWAGSPGYRLSFNFATYGDFVNPYRAAVLNDSPGTVTAVLPGTARVVNSSWGFTDPTGSAFGNNSRAVDGLAYLRGTTGNAPAVVFSAGNNGLGDGTVAGSKVGGPAAGYNVISVGALGTDTSIPQYNTVSSFSSRGPMPVFVPLIPAVTNIADPLQGTVINSARGRVDISSPGEQLTLAYYGGTTGGNQAPSQGGTPNGGTTFYSFNTSGTSFAAPTVAGGFTLMADAATTKISGVRNALDGRVMKAVLLNAADKTAGWSNASVGAGTTVSPYHTTQGLDYNVGAGRMNLNRTFDQYFSGTLGVANPLGDTVLGTGWAYGGVSSTTSTADYKILQALSGGTTFAATLSSFVNRSINASNVTLEQRFDNLSLEIYQLATQGGPLLPANLIAFSDSIYNTTEHVYFTLPATGYYAIRVEWIGTNWNFTGTDGANFGVAWSGVAPVPEPASVFAIACGGLLVVFRRRLRKPTVSS